MSWSATFGGETFNETNFAPYNYFQSWPRLMVALQTVSLSIETWSESAEAAAAAAAASLAAAQLITGGAFGIGAEPMDLPRATELGSAAFADINALTGLFFAVKSANYQVLPQDHRAVLVATASLTITLPIFADTWAGWNLVIKNRSGGNITLDRNGTNINGAGSNLTLANNTVTRVGRLSNAWETA